MTAQPPYDSVDSVTLSRARFEKRFSGALQAQSQVEMLAVRTAHEGSAGYVAVERIVGSIDGKTGSFAVVHTGVMNRGQQSLSIGIVPDSGTGALHGISGSMDIQIVDGQHYYTVDYELPD